MIGFASGALEDRRRMTYKEKVNLQAGDNRIFFLSESACLIVKLTIGLKFHQDIWRYNKICMSIIYMGIFSFLYRILFMPYFKFCILEIYTNGKVVENKNREKQLKSNLTTWKNSFQCTDILRWNLKVQIKIKYHNESDHSDQFKKSPRS